MCHKSQKVELKAPTDDRDVRSKVAKRIANVRFTLGPAKHEKVAIYVVNQRISNVYRIAGAASQRSKIPFDLNIIFMLLWLSSESAHMKQPSTVTSPGVICEEADNTKAWQRRMINIRLP